MKKEIIISWVKPLRYIRKLLVIISPTRDEEYEANQSSWRD